MDRLMLDIKTESEEQILPDSVPVPAKSKNKVDGINKFESCDSNFKVELTSEEHSLHTFNENTDPLNIPSNAHSFRKSENSSAFQCVFCMKYFVSSEKLQEHMNVYHPEDTIDISQNAGSQQTLECKYCFKECANSAGLKNHIRMLHKDEKEVIELEPKKESKCDICNRSFKRIYELLRHMNSVHNKKPLMKLICKFCKVAFHTTCSLTEHIENFHSQTNQDKDSIEKSDSVNYSDESWKKFECRYCFKECANSCGLKNHLRKAHRDEKDIKELKPKEKPKCEICDRTYNRIYELMRHLRTQHDCKPHKCSACFKVFITEDSLNLHIEKYHIQKGNKMSNEAEDSVDVERDDIIQELDEKDDTDDSEGAVDDVHQIEEENGAEDSEAVAMNVDSHISLKCKYCSKQCANICGLKNHLRTLHKNENGLKELEPKERPTCSICGRSFIRNHELMRHMTTHNKGKLLKCEFCSTTFLTEKNLANHIEKVHGITVEKLNFSSCKICSVTYMDEKLLEEHLLKRPFSCDICCKHFISELTYTVHNKKHHESSNFKCKECDKSFQQIDSLRSHMQSEHSDKSAKSPSDSELEPPSKLAKTNTSKYVNTKQSPMKTDNTTKGHKKEIDSGLECDICLEAFDNWDDLEKHKLTSSKYACKICRKHFQRILTLTEHMNTHSKEKIFQCEYCTRPYLMKGSLRTHIRNQHPTKVKIEDSRIKMFCCDDSTCNEKFPLYRDLVIHMRKHKGTKPYKCDLCKREFSVSAHLDVHKKRRHENVKPYSCDVCRKPFFRKKFMIKHFNKHTQK